MLLVDTTAAGCALFAFLDPFVAALDRAQLRSALLGRAVRAPTEVLLNFQRECDGPDWGLVAGAYRDVRALEKRDRKTVTNMDRYLGGNYSGP